MKLHRKIMSFLRTRGIAYRITKEHNKEALCNRLYDRFDKLCRCSDQTLYEVVAENEQKFREILPSPYSRFSTMRTEFLQLIDYAVMQSSKSVTA
jgi:cation transport regulator ChaC